MLPRFSELTDLLKKGITLEAQQNLLEVQETYLKLQEENLELKQKNADLIAKLSGRTELTWSEPFYWRKAEDCQFDWPYCQLCFDKDQKKRFA
jgi:hypothetical protein